MLGTALKDLFCPLGPTYLPNWNKFTINMTDWLSFQNPPQQCQMTDVFAVLFLMDRNRSFSLMLALADKDLIFAWQVK